MARSHLSHNIRAAVQRRPSMAAPSSQGHGRYLSAVLAMAIASSALAAQEPVVASAQPASATKEEHTKVVKPSPFYESVEPIEVTFTTNIGKIRGDKGTQPPWRPAT